MIRAPKDPVPNWLNDEIDFSTLAEASAAQEADAFETVIAPSAWETLDDLADAYLHGQDPSDNEAADAGTPPADACGKVDDTLRDVSRLDGFDFT